MSNEFFSPDGDLENYFVTEYWLIDQYIGDRLYTWGPGTLGQLGTNNTLTRSTPVTTFAGGNNWKQVSAANESMSAIKTNGTLWVWGNGNTGRLGTNATLSRSTPVTTFAGGNNWRQVSTAGNHTAAIKTDGTLWVWGLGTSGRLGTNDTVNRLTPVTTFAGGNNWNQVSSGSGFTAAIKTNGTLWVWGVNNALGINDTSLISRLTPVTTFAGGTNWKQVSCGDLHTSAIKTNGTLWTWGSSINGALGNNFTSSRETPVTTFAGGTNWKSTSSASQLTAAIKTDGTLWVWGNGTFSRLGTNDTTIRSTPVTTFAGGNNWKQVSAGNVNMAAIKTDGTLWTWGLGTSGQLGTNNTLNRSTPVTTFAGGTNWKQVSCPPFGVNAATPTTTSAVQSGIDETLSL